MARLWLKVGSCTLGKNGYGLGMDELPPSTLRLLYDDSYTPTFVRGTATQLSVSPNVWDFNFLGQDTYRILDASVNYLHLRAVVAGNTSGVTSVSGLFFGQAKLEYLCPLDLSSVTDMSDFLYINNQGHPSGWGVLQEIPALDTSNVVNMERAFFSCGALRYIGRLNTSNVTNMGAAFANCISLTSLPDGFDTRNVVTTTSVAPGGAPNPRIRGLFDNCTNLESVPPLDLRNTTDITSMFSNCKSITTIPYIDTSNIDVMTSTFEGASSLVSLPNNMDTKNVRWMSYMLRDCKSLKNIPLFNTDKVVAMNMVCENCINVESGALALYQQASTQTNPPVEHSSAFENCGINTVTGAAELAQIPSDWK